MNEDAIHAIALGQSFDSANAHTPDGVFAHPYGCKTTDLECLTCGSDCNERDELIKAEREIEKLRAKVASLELYENMAKEFGLSAFPDCAVWQQTLEAIADGRVMPRDGTHTHVEAVVAYQAFARQALAGVNHFATPTNGFRV